MNKKGVKTVIERHGKNYFKEIRKKRTTPGYFKDPEVARKAAQIRWSKWREAQVREAGDGTIGEAVDVLPKT